MRKTALIVGLVAPLAIFDTLALKLYVENMRADTKVAKTIQINKDNAKVSCGCSKSVIETDCKHKLKDIM